MAFAATFALYDVKDAEQDCNTGTPPPLGRPDQTSPGDPRRTTQTLARRRSLRGIRTVALDAALVLVESQASHADTARRDRMRGDVPLPGNERDRPRLCHSPAEIPFMCQAC